jgi:hypothetical protein
LIQVISSVLCEMQEVDVTPQMQEIAEAVGSVRAGAGCLIKIPSGKKP